jgi:hypothetical protein
MQFNFGGFTNPPYINIILVTSRSPKRGSYKGLVIATETKAEEATSEYR